MNYSTVQYSTISVVVRRGPDVEKKKKNGHFQSTCALGWSEERARIECTVLRKSKSREHTTSTHPDAAHGKFASILGGLVYACVCSFRHRYVEEMRGEVQDIIPPRACQFISSRRFLSRCYLLSFVSHKFPNSRCL